MAALCGPAQANVFLHSPRGSNNKLNEVSNFVRNSVRLFDSQNDPSGGYQVGDNCNPTCSDANGTYDSTMPGAGQGQMYFYEGSILDIEWATQHGCGSANDNVHCTMVLQYMCEDSAPGLRDGTSTDRIPDTTAGATDSQYGMHEPLQWYKDCQARMRNKGLYSADQELTGDSAAHTRQNPTGVRNGYECPEERDYYPYWHPTPWRDIAVMTDDIGHCSYYSWNSQNVRDYGTCCNKTHLAGTGECIQITSSAGLGPNSFAACQNDRQWGTWIETGNWGVDPPRCMVAPYSRDNQLADVAAPYGVVPSLELHPPKFSWKIPGDVFKRLDQDEATCVLRMRYNVSSADYDGWTVNSLFNGDNAKVSTNPARDFVGFSKDSGLLDSDFKLKLSVDTSRLGGTFEDRSHSFRIRRRSLSSSCKGANIYNLNTKGRRGSIVQVFPSVPYDFVPKALELSEGDCVHFQWTGSDANPVDNTGNGRWMTDRTNLVEMPALNLNVPARHGYAEVTAGGAARPTFRTMFPDEATVRRMAYLGQELDCSSGDCVSSLACNEDDDNDHSSANCKLLNAAPAYFDGGLVRMDKPGQFPFISTRNNAFAFGSQKGVIVVKAWRMLFIVGGSAALVVLIIFAVLITRWRIAVNADWRKPESSLARSFLYSTNCCFLVMEKTFCFAYPFTSALLLVCSALFAVGYWQAIADGKPAPFYPLAKGCGRVLDILCNLIFLPVLRNLGSWLRITPIGRVLPVDDNLYFHKLIGVLVALAFFGHIIFHYLNFIWHSTSGSGASLLTQTLMNWTGISGHLITLCMTLMMLTGLERFRRMRWGIPGFNFKFSGHSLFVRMHKMWLLVLILLWSHSKAFWQYSLFLVCMLITDKLIGTLRGRDEVEMIAARMPARDVLHITMRPTNGRRFKFQAGQYLFLNCPQVSKTEWHPFTISSSPWESTFSVHIKCKESMDWTYGIRKLLTADHSNDVLRVLEEQSSCNSQKLTFDFSELSETSIAPSVSSCSDTAFSTESRRSPKNSLKIGRHRLYVDGPYGTSSERVFEFKVMILVAAGVGVTPFASILKTLAYQAKNGVLETQLKKVAFFWTCRDESEFNSFKDIMVGIVNDTCLGQIFELNTYLTGEINLKIHRANEKYHQYAGRPDWNRIGKRIGDEHPDDDIGVFLCGPGAMAKELSAMCKKLNLPPSTAGSQEADSRSRRFKFHKESF